MTTATKEKELTLEMPLEELKEIREIWYDVCAFHQVLNGLDGSDDTYFALRQFHNLIHKRFVELLAGEPGLDMRICNLEFPRNGGDE